MPTKYIYKNTEHFNVKSVRDAIWETENIIFGTPINSDEWKSLGVEVVNYEDVIENPPVEPNLEELKQMKLGALKGAFEEYRISNEIFFVSSLGFKVNANVTAFKNVNGLIAQLQHKEDVGETNPTVNFMTFTDELVTLGIKDLKTIQFEISQNISNLYAQKWAIREAIQYAKNEETLNAIELVFDYTDFSIKV